MFVDIDSIFRVPATCILGMLIILLMNDLVHAMA